MYGWPYKNDRAVHRSAGPHRRRAGRGWHHFQWLAFASWKYIHRSKFCRRRQSLCGRSGNHSHHAGGTGQHQHLLLERCKDRDHFWQLYGDWRRKRGRATDLLSEHGKHSPELYHVSTERRRAGRCHGLRHQCHLDGTDGHRQLCGGQRDTRPQPGRFFPGRYNRRQVYRDGHLWQHAKLFL